MSQIHIKNLGFSLPHKVCFDDFSACVEHGSRIAVIGRNGVGKSTLLKIINGEMEAVTGDVQVSKNNIIAYVPQLIDDFNTLSGGQRFNKILSQALSVNPDILLIDEPTNHLDITNKRGLIRMLQKFDGTLIVVSHDMELLCRCVDRFWHINDGKIHIFAGNYNDYIANIEIQRAGLEKELSLLHRKKMEAHAALMKEQQRASKSKASGKKKVAQRKWLPAVGNDKANSAEKIAGKKHLAIEITKQKLLQQLENLRLPEVITPRFYLPNPRRQACTILSTRDGSVAHDSRETVVNGINISLNSTGRLAIIGPNGSGKSTILKAILGDQKVIRTGNWMVPKPEDSGYLDQHYRNLSAGNSPMEIISQCAQKCRSLDVRKHLSAFLFRKTEEVNCPIENLSGGEKVRLSLAKIVAETPKLLILDEITNNLDIETIDHVIQVLKMYPGALLVVSHDMEFLKKIEISEYYTI